MNSSILRVEGLQVLEIITQSFKSIQIKKAWYIATVTKSYETSMSLRLTKGDENLMQGRPLWPPGAGGDKPLPYKYIVDDCM
jgi:hypothetical protein